MAIDHAGQNQRIVSIQFDAPGRFVNVRRDPFNPPTDGQQIRMSPVRQPETAKKQRFNIRHAAHYIAKFSPRRCADK